MNKRSEEAWVKTEVEGGEFGDRCLDRPFEKVLSALAGRMGGSFSVTCQNWANTKAA